MPRHFVRFPFAALIAMILLLILGSLPPLAEALPTADAVVSAPCGEAEFNAALAAVQSGGGGTLTFSCGTATLGFTGEKIITSNVVIDGGGVITLDGGNATRFFKVLGGGSLTLRGMVLDHGNSGNDYGGAVYVNPGGSAGFGEQHHPQQRHQRLGGRGHHRLCGHGDADRQRGREQPVQLRGHQQHGHADPDPHHPAQQRGHCGRRRYERGRTQRVSRIEGNDAPEGGALSGMVEIQNSTVAPYASGRGHVYRRHCGSSRSWTAEFLQNWPMAWWPPRPTGGAIFNYGKLTVRGSSFEANIARGYGGAILRKSRL